MSGLTCLVDGTAYLFRGYYSVRPMQAPDGTPVNGVVGLANALVRLLRARKPARAAVAFDAGRFNFRHRIDPLYKANRGEPPEDLVPQFDLARRLSEAMGLATFCIADFEADDVLATLTRRARAEDQDVLLVSGDKDLGQLLGPGVRQYDLGRDEEWDAVGLVDRMGVRPSQVRDLLALMGDSSDNIPGVRGVGPKAAVALLGAFEDLDAIYADLDAVERLPVRGARTLRRKLEEGRADADRSRVLASLHEAVPLPSQDLQWRGPDRAVLDAFTQRWGIAPLSDRLGSTIGAAD